MTAGPISLQSKVFDALEDGIISGRYAAGASISELAISRELSVSRTPVREALHRLKEEGLVELIPNKGAVVIGVSTEDLVDIYKIRMRLEGLAASLAAEKMTDGEKSSLAENVELQRFYVSKNNAEKVKELDTEFHELIYAGCKSRTIMRTLSELHNSTKLYRKISLSAADRIGRSVEEHSAICRAICEGDAEKVDKLSSEHVGAALCNILKIIGKDEK